MSRQQFGSLAGFLIVAVWALGGAGVLFSALLAAAAGWLAAGALRRDRLGPATRPTHRHRTAAQEMP
ncbi:hypothetical protein [Melissospora conviva]|uniref:hypothetical protein n=1 Tax=Melissospora conviva TaxID=3388432 RepID=UPI003B7CE336